MVFQITGRDGYDMASQFDNKPPAADTRVEPIYQEYNFQGVDLFIETSLNTGEGKLYQELELPRRPYSDVEAERANQLSVLPNYQANCRLIYDPNSRETERYKAPRLVEHWIKTEELGKDEENPEIASRIRERSGNMAPTRDDVEDDINRRTRGIIDTEEPQTEEPKSDLGE